MLNILWCSGDREKRASHTMIKLRDEVAKYANVTVLTQKLPTEYITIGKFCTAMAKKEITPQPLIEAALNEKKYDFIMCDILSAFIQEPWETFNTPCATWLEDIQPKLLLTSELRIIKKNIFDVIFHAYNEPLTHLVPEVANTMNHIWLPFWADTNLFYPRGTKNIESILLGSRQYTVYPIRHLIHTKLRQYNFYHHIKRPSEGTRRDKMYPIDNDYAELLSRAHIAFACGSIYNYAVAKFMEISSSNTLLVSNYFTDLQHLGFRHKENMIVLNQNNVAQQTQNLLKKKDLIAEISQKGYELVTKYHSVEVRAKQMLNHISRTIGQKPEFNIEYDFYTDFKE